MVEHIKYKFSIFCVILFGIVMFILGIIPPTPPTFPPKCNDKDCICDPICDYALRHEVCGKVDEKTNKCFELSEKYLLYKPGWGILILLICAAIIWVMIWKMPKSENQEDISV